MLLIKVWLITLIGLVWFAPPLIALVVGAIVGAKDQVKLVPTGNVVKGMLKGWLLQVVVVSCVVVETGFKVTVIGKVGLTQL